MNTLGIGQPDTECILIILLPSLMALRMSLSPEPKANGWQASGLEARPEMRLADLLRKHRLPSKLRYELGSQSSMGSPGLSEVAVSSWPLCHLKGRGEGRHRSSAIHTLLIAAADSVVPMREVELGRVQASIKDMATMRAYFSRITREAATHAQLERIGDVNGIASFLDIHLRQPLNVFLDTMLAHVQFNIFWRAVADGDRTAWELVCESPDEVAVPLAVVRIEWPSWGSRLDQLVREVECGAIGMSENGRLGYTAAHRPAAESDDDAGVLRLGEHVSTGGAL